MTYGYVPLIQAPFPRVLQIVTLVRDIGLQRKRFHVLGIMHLGKSLLTVVSSQLTVSSPGIAFTFLPCLVPCTTGQTLFGSYSVERAAGLDHTFSILSEVLCEPGSAFCTP